MLKLVLELCEIRNELFSLCRYSWICRFRSCSMDIVNSLGLTISVSFRHVHFENLTRMTGHRSLAEGYANEFLSAVLN